MMEYIKNSVLPVISLIVIIIRAIVIKPAFDCSYLIIFGVVLMSLISALFKRTFVRWNMTVSKEEYAIFTVNLFVVISSLLPVLLAFILWK